MRVRALIVLALLLPPVLPAAADSASAERQYRIARRLAAEGSPEAARALEGVVEQDPRGPLADDALVELALGEGIARWPEELGRLAADRAAAARPRLERVAAELADGDRAPEALLLAGLLDLEPGASRDPSAARLALLRVATRPDAAEEIGSSARYALGWIAERSGDAGAAAATYQRVVIDHPATEAAARARAALGRVALRDGRFGDAAAHLQRAVERGVAGAEDLRELAVRSLLRARQAGGGWSVERAQERPTGMRGTAAIARIDGGVALAERRENEIVLLLEEERVGVPLAGVRQLAVDGYGRLFAATADAVYRVERSGAVRVVELDDYSGAAAMAADDNGRLWFADRRGSRLGVLDGGAPSVRTVSESKDRRLAALAWSGAGLVGLDTKAGRLVRIDAAGVATSFGAAPGQRPVALAADAAGQLAVLDQRADSVLLLDAAGEVLERRALDALGVKKPAPALALGADGSLDVVDTSRAVLRRLP